jgi:hypothetical protein
MHPCHRNMVQKSEGKRQAPQGHSQEMCQAEDLHCMPINYRCHWATIMALTHSTQALQVATSKDMAMCKEAIQAKWNQMSGKPNKDFLTKQKGRGKE